MSKIEILRLVAGFKKFRERYFKDEHSLYHKLSVTTGSGQSPKTLIIGCSDSRVDPALITSASPGELFVVRNVANLVPPYETGGKFHGVSSAIEFAVVNLKVHNIIVLGHRQCGGIRSLMLDDGLDQTPGFVRQWVSIAKQAKEVVLKKHEGAAEDVLCKACELESIKVSIENLKTFPFIQKAINERDLNLMGIYFDLEQGQLFELDKEKNDFDMIQI